jgi:hypothetical protein
MADSNKINLFQEDTESIIALAERIIQKHNSLGPHSPISNAVIADLQPRISAARTRHDEAMQYKKLMDTALRERDHYLGKDKGVAHTLTAIGNILTSNNESVNDWGF